MRSPIGYLFLALPVLASQKVFSVHDDLFAYPEFEIVFPDEYILEADAHIKLSKTHDDADLNDGDGISHEYEFLSLHNDPYLCSIPQAPMQDNSTDNIQSEEDKKKELARAADRGWGLLQGMEGKQCLYYTTGWWSYSFCYNLEVRQFHALPAGVNGRPVWPPQEDPNTPSFVLGKYDAKAASNKGSSNAAVNPAGELQVKAESSYLVQTLGGGTQCDLTHKPRKIEVQFHCHPQLTDRIGWIKETATCTYQMVVYTPRLCNDVAFQPPKQGQAQIISCQRILAFQENSAIAKTPATQPTLEESSSQTVMVGNVEVGAMKHLGRDGRQLERGRIVMTPEERAEVVVMSKNGLIHGLTSVELQKLSLDPAQIKMYRERMQEKAEGHDWRIERIVTHNGQIELRGIISDEDDDNDEGEHTDDDPEGGDEEQGSEEIMKEEL